MSLLLLQIPHPALIKQYRLRLEEVEILAVLSSQVQLHPGNYCLHSCVSFNPSHHLSPLPTSSPGAPELAVGCGDTPVTQMWACVTQDGNQPCPGFGWSSCLSVAALTILCALADTQGGTAPAPKALGIKRQTAPS